MTAVPLKEGGREEGREGGREGVPDTTARHMRPLERFLAGCHSRDECTSLACS